MKEADGAQATSEHVPVIHPDKRKVNPQRESEVGRGRC